MNKVLLPGLAAAALLAACQTGPKIRVTVDPAANLSAYKTYAFPEKAGTDRGEYSTPVTSYFKEAIRREMDARGYKFVEGESADLLVNFNANAKENVDVRSTCDTASARPTSTSSTWRRSRSSGRASRRAA